MQELLGIANFYRKFITDFVKLAVYLMTLTRKDQLWSWTPSSQKTLDALKQVFTSAPILAHFDSSLQSMVETDASDYTGGVVHWQVQKNGRIHPCTFLSRKFLPAEMNYYIHDKEMVAIVFAFQEYEVQLKSCQLQVIM